MAKKKKLTGKDEEAKQKKAASAKAGDGAENKSSTVKKNTEIKSSAAKPKAVTNKKTTGTMAKKTTPADANDETPKVPAAPAAMEPQAVSEDQKKKTETRMANTDELNKIISDKIKPMFSKVVKQKSKTTTAAPATAGNKALPKTFTSMPSDKPADDAEIAMVSFNEEAPASAPVEVTHVEVTDEKETGSSFLGLTFDWDKMDSKPFEELIGFFEKSTREEVEVEITPGEEPPMVIVADFTLPYRCCEDYVCQDMCYSDDELAMLPIPPFAKDDFAVTRKNTPVDIYPDLNDSHLFKDVIVVKEIKEGASFESHAHGRVTTDNSGEHPHFIYTPPEDGSGISDYFFYTLYNTKNGLSDVATVWIEVAEALPRFSMDETVCSNAGIQTIELGLNGNDINDIDISGNGIEVLVDTGTGDKLAWTFNPKGLHVVIGSNPIVMKLNGKEVQTINVTVAEILANFLDQGELTSLDKETGIGRIIIHDQSLNATSYSWKWSINSEVSFQGTMMPDQDGNVIMDTPGVPANADFIMSVSLKVKSPEGCEDTKKMDVGISSGRKPTRSIEIIKRYSKRIPELIPQIDPQVKKIIDPKIFVELNGFMSDVGKQSELETALQIIIDGGFDKTISDIGSNIEKMLPLNSDPKTIPLDGPFLETVFTAAIISFSLLAIRSADADARANPAMFMVLNEIVTTMDNLALVGYEPPALLFHEFESIEQEVLNRSVLREGFDSVITAFIKT